MNKSIESKTKRVYAKPEVACVKVDNEISLVMMSPPSPPASQPTGPEIFFNPMKFFK